MLLCQLNTSVCSQLRLCCLKWLQNASTWRESTNSPTTTTVGCSHDNVFDCARYAATAAKVAEPASTLWKPQRRMTRQKRQKRSFAAIWRQAQVMNKTCFGRHTDGDEASDVLEINLQQVEYEPIYYLYIISYIQDCKCSSEIRKRIAMAKAAFTDLSNILTNKTLHINSNKRLMKCYI